MAIQTTTMPGYRLNEYMLVISPNESLRERIGGVRSKFAEQFGTMASTARPHVVLVRFVTWNMMEERLISRFEQIAMGFRPFRIELKDFGSYPAHTIFINVATKLPVQELVKSVRSAQRLMKVHPDHDPHFMHDPHITIARKLKPWQYEKAWLEYSQAHFSAKMVAEDMLLLGRPLGDKRYQILRCFEFRNMPVATTQGNLF